MRLRRRDALALVPAVEGGAGDGGAGGGVAEDGGAAAVVADGEVAGDGEPVLGGELAGGVGGAELRVGVLAAGLASERRDEAAVEVVFSGLGRLHRRACLRGYGVAPIVIGLPHGLGEVTSSGAMRRIRRKAVPMSAIASSPSASGAARRVREREAPSR